MSCSRLGCSVLFFSRPRSEGWPHNTMDVLSTFISVLCHSDWLFHGQSCPRFWCPSRPCVVFLACVHMAFFLALSRSPGNSLVSSWCDHSMLASLLWRCLTVPFLRPLCWEPTHLFSLQSARLVVECWLVICLERSADLHTAQLMPLPLTVSCFSEMQIGFTFLVPAHPGNPGQRAVKWVYVCMYDFLFFFVGTQCRYCHCMPLFCWLRSVCHDFV